MRKLLSKSALVPEYGSLTSTPAQLAQAIPIAQVTDESLMAAFQKGDLQSFEILLARHRKPVYNYILRFLRRPETAEDAFQEVFLRVVRSAQDYRPSAKFTTWLYTLARHYCIDVIRKEKLRQHESFDAVSVNEEGVSRARVIADQSAADGESYSADRDREDVLNKALQALPPEQREVVLLREYQGLSFDDVANVTGVSVNTVKSRMRYALLALRRRLGVMGWEG